MLLKTKEYPLIQEYKEAIDGEFCDMLVEFFLKGLAGGPNLLEGIVLEHASVSPMEGKGDQLPMSIPVLGEDNSFYHLIVNCSGRRTSLQALEEYALKTENYVLDIPLSNDPKTGAYHGNVAIFYFQDKEGNRGVTYVPKMLLAEKRGFIHEAFCTLFGSNHVHAITEEDLPMVYGESLRNLTMNVISVGQGRIISSSNNHHTNGFLEEVLGLEVLPVDMQAIALGGGGLQCCYTAINRQPLEIVKPAGYIGKD